MTPSKINDPDSMPTVPIDKEKKLEVLIVLVIKPAKGKKVKKKTVPKAKKKATKTTAKKKTISAKPTTKTKAVKKASTPAKQKTKKAIAKKKTVPVKPKKKVKAASPTVSSGRIKKTKIAAKQKSNTVTVKKSVSKTKDKEKNAAIKSFEEKQKNIVKSPDELPIHTPSEDLNIVVPEKDEITQPVTPFPTHKKENIFRNKEKVAIQQENQKIKNAQPSRKTMKVYNRHRGRG